MTYQFGEKLRHIRKKRKITMKEVSEMVGVTESLISQIETNRVSPAIDTLLKIAEVLQVDMDYLFRDWKQEKPVIFIKRTQRNRLNLNGVTYEQLSKTVSENSEHGIEAYFLHIKPGKQSGNEDYGHQGKELGVIMEGNGEFEIGNKTYILHEGDSVSFDSDVPHVLKNTGEKNLKAFWVITPPKKFF
jgi:transcriptional regulator with XRE-family HTH domain